MLLFTEHRPSQWGGEDDDERERTETGIRNRPPFQTRPGKKYAVQAHPSLRYFYIFSFSTYVYISIYNYKWIHIWTEIYIYIHTYIHISEWGVCPNGVFFPGRVWNGGRLRIPVSVRSRSSSSSPPHWDGLKCCKWQHFIARDSRKCCK